MNYQDLVDEFVISHHAAAGKIFGMPCLKINGSVFASQAQNGDLVLKLPAQALEQALKIEGSALFEPMTGAKMREWVQIPLAHADLWRDLAGEALEYVKEVALTKPKKKKK